MSATRPTFKFENLHGRQTGALICGIDEAGRGPLAGPVVAAAVVWPLTPRRLKLWSLVNDSKQVAPAMRHELAFEIKACTYWGIGLATVEEIDTINIYHATMLAMCRAVAALQDAFALETLHCLIDGNAKPKSLAHPCRTVIGGDALSLSIAAASILAKTHRDAAMQTLAAAHPEYNWHSNVGYSTPAHLRALQQHGPTPHHRRSFAPVRHAHACADISLNA